MRNRNCTYGGCKGKPCSENDTQTEVEECEDIKMGISQILIITEKLTLIDIVKTGMLSLPGDCGSEGMGACRPHRTRLGLPIRVPKGMGRKYPLSLMLMALHVPVPSPVTISQFIERRPEHLSRVNSGMVNSAGPKNGTCSHVFHDLQFLFLSLMRRIIIIEVGYKNCCEAITQLSSEEPRQ